MVVTSQKVRLKIKKDESAGDNQGASLVSCNLPGFIEKLHIAKLL